jgi:hypothetical protein
MSLAKFIARMRLMGGDVFDHARTISRGEALTGGIGKPISPAIGAGLKKMDKAQHRALQNLHYGNESEALAAGDQQFEWLGDVSDAADRRTRLLKALGM